MMSFSTSSLDVDLWKVQRRMKILIETVQLQWKVKMFTFLRHEIRDLFHACRQRPSKRERRYSCSIGSAPCFWWEIIQHFVISRSHLHASRSRLFIIWWNKAKTFAKLHDKRDGNSCELLNATKTSELYRLHRRIYNFLVNLIFGWRRFSSMKI